MSIKSQQINDLVVVAGNSRRSAPASYPAKRHDSSHLITVFDRLFAIDEQTRLCGGADEPLYEPAGGDPYNRVIFTRDYFASALHEVAHWCLAGAARRRLRDYGYWYLPDGRDSVAQARFEQVEIKPQALEWIFSRAACWRFRVSADNVAGDGPSARFCEAIWQQARQYCKVGLPHRADCFAAALADTHGGFDYLNADAYRLEDLP